MYISKSSDHDYSIDSKRKQILNRTYFATPLRNGADELLGADVHNVALVLVDECHLGRFIGQWHHQMEVLIPRVLQRHLVHQGPSLGMIYKQGILQTKHTN